MAEGLRRLACIAALALAGVAARALPACEPPGQDETPAPGGTVNDGSGTPGVVADSTAA